MDVDMEKLEEIKNDPNPWLHDDEPRMQLIAECERLRDTIVMDETGRPRHLWELIERIEKAEAELARLTKRNGREL